jgi:hypothetical protein
MGVLADFRLDRTPIFEPLWMVVAREEREKERRVEDQVVVQQDEDGQKETPGAPW